MTITIDLTADQIKKIAAHILAEWAGVTPPTKLEEELKPYNERKKLKRKLSTRLANLNPKKWPDLYKDVVAIVKDYNDPIDGFGILELLKTHNQVYNELSYTTLSPAISELRNRKKLKAVAKNGLRNLYQVTSRIKGEQNAKVA